MSMATCSCVSTCGAGGWSQAANHQRLQHQLLRPMRGCNRVSHTHIHSQSSVHHLAQVFIALTRLHYQCVGECVDLYPDVTVIASPVTCPPVVSRATNGITCISRQTNVYLEFSPPLSFRCHFVHLHLYTSVTLMTSRTQHTILLTSYHTTPMAS